MALNANANANANIKNQINIYSHLEKICLINFDEKGKEYTKFDNIDQNIKDKIVGTKYDIYIICTQNSISGNNKHLQHLIKERLEGDNYKLLCKVDATTHWNSRSPITKFKNVRTRVYYNPENVYPDFSLNKFKHSYSNEHGKYSKINIRESTSFNETVSSGTKVSPTKNKNIKNNYEMIIKSLKIQRITPKDEKNRKGGKGIIYLYLEFKLDNKNVLPLLIINNHGQNNNGNNNIIESYFTKAPFNNNKDNYIYKCNDNKNNKKKYNTLNNILINLKYNVGENTNFYNSIDNKNEKIKVVNELPILVRIKYIKYINYYVDTLKEEKDKIQFLNFISKLNNIDKMEQVHKEKITKMKLELFTKNHIVNIEHKNAFNKLDKLLPKAYYVIVE
jgi:hypothetical protein